jgi:hypothetical protein
MGQAAYKLKSERANKELIRRMENEILKLEAHLSRLQTEYTPHRDSMMKTYNTMIKSRKEVLEHMCILP